MFLEYWMIGTLVACFGACALISYETGRKVGVYRGIEGTFEYLTEKKIIQVIEDGTIYGLEGKVKGKIS